MEQEEIPGKEVHKPSFYAVNAITIYRGAAAFLLLYLVIREDAFWFKWLLALSLFTDAIDGFLARKYKVVSVMGSRLDSIADDLTILIAIVGLIVFKNDFIRSQLFLILILVGLYLFQLFVALIRYRKPTSFHTYLAKAAMIMQGAFLISVFFLPNPPLMLFYIAAGVTIADLLEEILLVFLLPTWTTDIRGWYWLREHRS